MDALPRPARWYLYSIWLLAALVLFEMLQRAPAPTPAMLIVLLAGTIAFVLADIFAVNFDIDDNHGVLMTVVDTVTIFLIGTVGLAGLAVTFGGSIISDILARRPWYKGLFNAAQRSLTYVVVTLLYLAICGAEVSPYDGWRGLAALVVMCTVYFVMNALLVAGVVALASGQPLLKICTESLLQVHWIQFITLPLGAVLAIIWHFNPWMLLPALIPAVMAYRSFKAMSSLQIESRRSQALAVQAQRLADKLERLQDTTTAMLASDEPQPLLEEVSHRLATLLGARAAWVILAEAQPRLAAARGLSAREGVNLAASMAELRLHTLSEAPSAAFLGPDSPWPVVLHIPMLSGGRLIGGFCLALEESPPLADDDRRVLLAFAAQAALAVERTQLFDQLRTKQEELLRTSKLAALGTFAAGIAHEFNNLLTAISGFAQLGLGSDDVGEKNEALEVALRTSRRGESITAGLLTFARRRDARRELCQIREVLDETLSLVERQLVKANVTIRREYEPVPRTYCDPGQIAQVVMNLITNARDAMADRQSGVLTLGLRQRGGQIELRVSDSGVGISDELLGQIFSPFMTTKGPFGSGGTTGTGLGLAISHGIIERHDGTIEVQSELGRGTTFVVRLPVISASEEAARKASENEREVSA